LGGRAERTLTGAVDLVTVGDACQSAHAVGADDVEGAVRHCRRITRWSMPMWILMYVFSYSVSPAATNDRTEWRLLPTVVFQEFSNEERCKAAKSTLEGSLKEAGAKLKSGLEDLKSIGKGDPAQIIIAFNVECLPK
jgi:hypothetical protein